MAVKPISAAGPDLIARLTKLSTAIEKGRRDTLLDAGLAAKKAHNRVIASHVGSDMRMSGVGKRGAKVGARFDMRGDRLEMKATGPLHFVAHPMSPHRIPKQRGKRARRRFAVIPGVGVRSSAQHPGTAGKNTWVKGARSARPKIKTAIRKETANVVKRGFG